VTKNYKNIHNNEEKHLFSSTKKDSGFTIIEVMIVLAIAGVIMLIVFLAVPTLQRNLRNRKRSADAAIVLSVVAEYYENTHYQVPSTCTGLACPFFNNLTLSQFDVANINFIKAPSGVLSPADYFTNDPDTLSVIAGAECASGGSSDRVASNFRNPSAILHATAAVFQYEGATPGNGQYLYTNPAWNLTLRKCIDNVT
jgi:prepilin-type N-terminal cleavage/methylation domain-containing protein